MLKRVFYFALLAASSCCIGAKELHQDTLIISSGQNYVVPKDVTALSVERLILEEKASLTIHPSLSQFELTAKKSFFAKDSSIIAKGQDGRTGGKNGGRGVDLTLDLGSTSIYGLTVITQGGNGSRGLTGALGLRGADASCTTMTPGQNGGQGGQGGAGGNGADSGNVMIYLAKYSEPINIDYKMDGGEGGEGGPGGEGGEGGKGKGKCGLYPYDTSFSGGHQGPIGIPGISGKRGNGSGSRTIKFK